MRFTELSSNGNSSVIQYATKLSRKKTSVNTRGNIDKEPTLVTIASKIFVVIPAISVVTLVNAVVVIVVMVIV
uniref:Uncharacterized protein n=1 Tax=Glossina palpalis gambiensis TaxID=67801 RepID=A0A1B0AKR1_9MUSC